MALVLLMGVCAIARAQDNYQIHTWESFEGGDIPKNLVRFLMSSEESVRVVDYRSTNFPPSVTSGVAGLECGRYGLFLKPSKKERFLSLFGPDGLDRGRLGTTGRALYQMDVYLPEEGVPLPTVSLLAQVLGGTNEYVFYRFGILEPGDRVFFSFTNGGQQPVLYFQQMLPELKVSRPGWHRFQIVFQGPDKIFCAVDGQVTSFSPITDGTHRVLNAGIMCTSARYDTVALVDNLSIQWTAQDSELPISPWTLPMPSDRVANKSPLETGSSVIWFSDPQQAWALASRQKRPILILFYIPEITPYRYLRSIVPNNDSVYQQFNQYILLRVDANQLYGGRLAEKFRIMRIPTLLVLGPDGKEIRRLIIAPRETTWEQIQKELFDVAPPTAPVAAGALGADAGTPAP